MSTTWWVPIPPNARNAELAIRKITGWKKYDCKENPMVQVLTDGKYFIYCDRRPIEILDHGKFATLERYNRNYPMEKTLEQIDGAFSEHDEPSVTNCDNCGCYMMSDEIYTDEKEESVICRRCHIRETK